MYSHNLTCEWYGIKVDVNGNTATTSSDSECCLMHVPNMCSLSGHLHVYTCLKGPPILLASCPELLVPVKLRESRFTSVSYSQGSLEIMNLVKLKL